MSIRYPKYKNGEELVRTVPVPPTYKYVEDLKGSIFQLDKKILQEKMKQFQKRIPGPLCSKFDEKLGRDAAIEKYKKRKRTSVELYPSCKFFVYIIKLVLEIHCLLNKFLA
jgi:hypothetical protein